MENYLAIDVGGTALKIGLLTEEGEILESDSKKTPKTLDAFYQIIEDTFHEYEGVKGNRYYWRIKCIRLYSWSKYKRRVRKTFTSTCGNGK